MLRRISDSRKPHRNQHPRKNRTHNNAPSSAMLIGIQRPRRFVMTPVTRGLAAHLAR